MPGLRFASRRARRVAVWAWLAAAALTSGSPAPATANGAPTAAISATPATRRSIRSTATTSTTSRSPGGSRPTAWARGRNTTSSRRRSWSTAGSTRRPDRAAPSWRSTPAPASCCGCTARTRARAARPRRGSSPAAGWRTGATARDERILYVTPGYRLIALDAKTGVPIAGFGTRGVVDLKLDNDQEIDLVDRRGRAACRAGRRRGHDHHRRRAPGELRARRARRTSRATCAATTSGPGKRSWIFHTIPRPGEFGAETLGRQGVARVHRQHRRVGADQRGRGARPRRTCRWSCRPATSTAAIVRATGCSARASSRSI